QTDAPALTSSLSSLLQSKAFESIRVLDFRQRLTEILQDPENRYYSTALQYFENGPSRSRDIGEVYAAILVEQIDLLISSFEEKPPETEKIEKAPLSKGKDKGKDKDKEKQAAKIDPKAQKEKEKKAKPAATTKDKKIKGGKSGDDLAGDETSGEKEGIDKKPDSKYPKTLGELFSIDLRKLKQSQNISQDDQINAVFDAETDGNANEDEKIDIDNEETAIAKQILQLPLSLEALYQPQYDQNNPNQSNTDNQSQQMTQNQLQSRIKNNVTFILIHNFPLTSYTLLSLATLSLELAPEDKNLNFDQFQQSQQNINDEFIGKEQDGTSDDQKRRIGSEDMKKKTTTSGIQGQKDLKQKTDDLSKKKENIKETTAQIKSKVKQSALSATQATTG
ncbi:MAG: hypothetical protein EZS28_045618, partial [Streblomastix strix]